MNEPKLFSIDDAASLLGAVSPWTLRKHIANGTIRVTRIGRRVLLPAEEVERIRQEGLPSLRSHETLHQAFAAPNGSAIQHGEHQHE